MNVHELKPHKFADAYDWIEGIETLEYAPVVNLAEPDDDHTECERDDWNMNPDFYTIYGWVPEHGTEILGDFEDWATGWEHAKNLAQQHNVILADYTGKAEVGLFNVPPG